MEFRQLEYFSQIVEQGSFTAAARKCGVAQPSLSTQIQKLEEELGEPLLLRRARGVSLTSSGQRVYEEAKTLLQGRDGLVATFREREDTKRCQASSRKRLMRFFVPLLSIPLTTTKRSDEHDN